MCMLMPTLDRFRAQRIVDWLPDLALSGALTVVTQVSVWDRGVFPGPTLVNSALALLMTGALLWRRRRPVPVLAIIVTAIAAQALAFGAVESAAVLLPLLAAVYAAAAYGGPAYVVAAISLLAVAVHTLRDPAVTTLGEAAFTPLVAGIVFVLGRIVHARRTSAELADARADQVQRDREREIADAVAEERRRIAREMHDVVAHGVSVMALQAGAAEQILDRDPERARDSLHLIRQTGHEVVKEMGRLVALLRDDSDGELEPLPSLGSVPAAVSRMRSAGLQIEVVVDGESRPLGAAVELAAFRIVQEGLTNALKHAPNAATSLLVRYHPESVELEVVSASGSATQQPGTGRGLIGIAERVTFVGGRLEVGPQAEGGWRVHALLPVAP